jgi:two-component system response regulator AtoC
MQTANKNGCTILLGEDESEVRHYLEMALTCHGYVVVSAQDGEEVLSILKERGQAISAILLDIMMPRKDGIEALKEIRRINKTVPVIMLSGASAPLQVVDAMKNGANDFFPKPVSHDDLRKALKTILETQLKPAPEPEPAPAPEPPAWSSNKHIFFGNNASMKAIHDLVDQIGWAEAPVLIQGETGVGKEVLARELHARSPRAKKPLLKLNCAALPAELVESELFGYERGAFTGAFQRKPGMFEQADGGTILLDEIGDMDFKLQAKLLQVLQDHEFQRLGGKETVRVDLRVIGATHRDLEKAIADGTFREDLYYRLNVINLRIPPLRERKEDIVRIAEFLIQKHVKPGIKRPAITPSLRQAFLLYDWPGNIRELENLVRKFLILGDAEFLARELSEKSGRHAASRTAPSVSTAADELPDEATILEQVTKAKQQAETTAIVAALNSTHWNRKQAAILLKIDYKALLYKMKKLNIDDRAAIQASGESNAEPLPEESRVSAAGRTGTFQ